MWRWRHLSETLSRPTLRARITARYCRLAARALIGRRPPCDWSGGVASEGCRGGSAGSATQQYGSIATPAPGSNPAPLIWFQSAHSLHSPIVVDCAFVLTITRLLFNWLDSSGQRLVLGYGSLCSCTMSPLWALPHVSHPTLTLVYST